MIAALANARLDLDTASGAPDAAADLLGTWVESLGWTADSLYVATLDAGADESVAFWREALEKGLVFANPRMFPWTLSNSPTGSLARRLGIRGPTYTLVGGGSAFQAALRQAEDDVAASLVEAPLVVAHSRVEGHLHVSAMRLAA